MQNPVGRISVGPTHVAWCASPTLCGTIHWGRPDVEGATELTRRLDFTNHPDLAGGFSALVNTSAMEGVDARVFAIVSGDVGRRVATWDQTVRRLAIVLAPGVMGALTTSLFPLFGARLPIRFSTDLASALDWLDRPELPRALEEVGRVIEEVRDLQPILLSLRKHLGETLRDASIESAAGALQTTPRTLQRELRRLGAQFKGELARARVRAARDLLEHSDEKIDLVAHHVGLSVSQLHATFRQLVGETPAEFRARRRDTLLGR